MNSTDGLLRSSSMVLVLLGISLVLTACGSNAALAPEGKSQRPITARNGSFELAVWPESYLGEQVNGSFALEVIETSDGASVSVFGDKLSNLRAFYFTLNYDAAKWNPQAARASGALGAPQELISLPYMDKPGWLDFGQVLAKPEQKPGLSGQALLATVSFKPGPAVDRTASRPPLDNTNAPVLIWNREEDDSLRWSFGGIGDYDQNGEVNIADLTPLGQLFKDAGPFLVGGEHFAADGDANGEINLADITSIGQNYGDQINAYRVYAFDPNELGLPAAGAVLVGELGAADAIENVAGALELAWSIFDDVGIGVPGFAQERIARYDDGAYHLDLPETAGMTDVRLCVVPVVGTTEGEPSNPVGGPPAQLVFTLDPPAPGSGTPFDPFFVDENSTHSLNVTHPTLGDISTEVQLLVSGIEIYSASGTSKLASEDNPFMDFFENQIDVAGRPEFQSKPVPDSVKMFQAKQQVVLNKAGRDGLGVALAEALVILVDGESEFRNQPPTVELAVSPSRGFVGTQFQISLGDRDVDGTITATQLKITGPGTDFTLAVPFMLTTPTQPGIYEVEGTATDDFGQTARGKIKFEVVANPDGVPPSVTINSPPPSAVVGVGSPINVSFMAGDNMGLSEIRVTTTDPNAAIDPAVIDVSGQTAVNSSSGVTFSQPGTYTITVTAVDAFGATTSQSVEVTAVANQPPIADLQASSTTVFMGETITFDGAASTDNDGTIQKYSFDFDGDGTVDDAVGPLVTSVQHSYNAPGTYLVILTVEDNLLATNLNVAEVFVTVVNRVPTASFTIDPNPAITGSQVTFEAASSGDQDFGDSIKFVRFDFDNNGSFEVELDFELDTSDVQTFATAGTYPINCQAEDQFGGISTTATQNLVVQDFAAEDWQTVVVDDGTGDDIGQYCSLAIINGNPAIACLNATDNDPVFIRAADADGTDWSGGFVNVATTPGVLDGAYAALLALADGTPAVAFQNTDAYDVLLARATNINGSSFNAPVMASNGVNAGSGSGIDVVLVNGNPAITFYDPDFGGTANFVRASAADGSAWNGVLQIAFGVGGAGSISLLYENLLNRAMFGSLLDGGLWFSEATNQDATGWDGTYAVNASNSSAFAFCQLPSGIAAFYQDLVSNDVVVEQPTDVDRDMWDGTVGVLNDLSFALTALDVAVADAQHVYIALAGASGVYALHSTDGSGLTYGDLVEIDLAANVAVRNLSLAILASGKPAVAYFDTDTGALMFGRLTN